MSIADPTSHEALDAARLTYWEEPAAARAVAMQCRDEAQMVGDRLLESRALTLQGAVSLHAGNLTGAFAFVAEADGLAGEDLVARTEIAALKTHLHYFSGANVDSMQWAREAVELSDRTGSLGLRLHARRMACLAFGNIGISDLAERFDEVLALARAARSPWEQAIAHNDLAHLCMVEDRLTASDDHIARGLRLADEVPPANFLHGVLHATRSSLHLHAGDPRAALVDARRAVASVVAAAEEANPYLVGMAVLAEVEALLALDRLDDARLAADHAVERLGERVPQVGSMLLAAVAKALRETGRAEEAYDTLARAADLERAALNENAQVQLGLQRARLETGGGRRAD